MGTMSFGYHYNRGKKVGYNISFGNIFLPHVSYKDKNRIIKEIQKNGYSRKNIEIIRVEE